MTSDERIDRLEGAIVELCRVLQGLEPRSVSRTLLDPGSLEAVGAPALAGLVRRRPSAAQTTGIAGQAQHAAPGLPRRRTRHLEVS